MEDVYLEERRVCLDILGVETCNSREDAVVVG